MKSNLEYSNYFRGKMQKSLLKKEESDKLSKKDLILNIKCSFNNTIATITDFEGNVLAWSSPACHGFKGSNRSTVFAARVAITEIAKNMQSLNVQSLDVRLKGLGPGRRKITKILKDHGISICSLQDVTPLPFNGTRLRRKRRI
jgi:small subunit ribosomal protein S11